MSELQHHGIMGMKWGVRRFQNKDGSLTPAGAKRYTGDSVPRDRLAKVDGQDNRKKEPFTQRNVKTNHEDHNKAHDKKSASELSDAELRSRLNRIQMEQQYNKLQKSTISNGFQKAKTAIAVFGTVSLAMTTAINLKNNAEVIKGWFEDYAGNALSNIVIDKI